MWLLKRFVRIAKAGTELSRLALRFPRRLRDRVGRFGLADADGFELEGIGLIFALTVIEIQHSEFDERDQKQLVRQFEKSFADQVLRRRLTRNLYEIHRPLDAVVVAQSMKGLSITSHEVLQLSDLSDFLRDRTSIYTRESLEQMIDRFMRYLEVANDFQLRFSLAVFITDTMWELRDHIRQLSRANILVE